MVNDKNLNIYIKGHLEQDTTTKNINDVLEKIQQQLKPIKINIDIKHFEQNINTLMEKLRQIGNVEIKLNIKDTIQKTKEVVKGIKGVAETANNTLNYEVKNTGELIKRVQELSKKSLKDVYTFRQNQGKYQTLFFKEGQLEKIKDVIDYTRKAREELLTKNLGNEQLGILPSILGDKNKVKQAIQDYYSNILKTQVEVTKLQEKWVNIDDKNYRVWSYVIKEIGEGSKVRQFKGNIDELTKSLREVGEPRLVSNLGRLNEQVKMLNLGMIQLPGASNVEDIKKVIQDYYTKFLNAEIEITRLQPKWIASPEGAKKLWEYTIREIGTGDKIRQIKGHVDDLTKSIYQIGEPQLINNLNRHLNFWEQMNVALTRIPVWIAGMTVFYQTLRYFQYGIRYVNDLNQQLTQISIVTNKSANEVANLAKEYNQLAIQLGVTTREIAEATVTFYRQGLSQAEVMERVKYATMGAKISSLSFAETAELLTAATNGMNISIERASDVFAYLGDATATGYDEIARAFQKVSGTAGALGIPFEKLASWIAVISSNTRESAESIGTSLVF